MRNSFWGLLFVWIFHSWAKINLPFVFVCAWKKKKNETKREDYLPQYGLDWSFPALHPSHCGLGITVHNSLSSRVGYGQYLNRCNSVGWKKSGAACNVRRHAPSWTCLSKSLFSTVLMWIFAFFSLNQQLPKLGFFRLCLILEIFHGTSKGWGLQTLWTSWLTVRSYIMLKYRCLGLSRPPSNSPLILTAGGHSSILCVWNEVNLPERDLHSRVWQPLPGETFFFTIPMIASCSERGGSIKAFRLHVRQSAWRSSWGESATVRRC